jgi:hypothetical protein
MKKKAILKHVACLLLFAMVAAVVPFHQLLHKHTDPGKATSLVHVKKFEKPCCKLFDGVNGDVSLYQPEYKSTPDFGAVSFSIIALYFSTPFFHFSNKAPPVVIA